MEDQLAKARRQHLSRTFFFREAADEDQASQQRSRLRSTYDNSGARYHELMEGRGALPEDRGIQDQVVAYVWFRCLEYSEQCLRVTTIYGLLPIVRALYEHFLRLHWCTLAEDNCFRYVEASDYQFMKRGAALYRAVEAHRKRVKANPRMRRNVKRVFRRLRGWKGRKTQPRWNEMATSSGFPEQWSEFVYPLFSERTHGSGWEEFIGRYTEAEEFIIMLGFADYFLERATNAAEDWLRYHRPTDPSKYTDGILADFGEKALPTA